MLPNKDGFKILNDLRKEKVDTPIIILTAKSEINDKLNGLENGADDYITKPFHIVNRNLSSKTKLLMNFTQNIPVVHKNFLSIFSKCIRTRLL